MFDTKKSLLANATKGIASALIDNQRETLPLTLGVEEFSTRLATSGGQAYSKQEIDTSTMIVDLVQFYVKGDFSEKALRQYSNAPALKDSRLHPCVKEVYRLFASDLLPLATRLDTGSLPKPETASIELSREDYLGGSLGQTNEKLYQLLNRSSQPFGCADKFRLLLATTVTCSSCLATLNSATADVERKSLLNALYSRVLYPVLLRFLESDAPLKEYIQNRSATEVRFPNLPAVLRMSARNVEKLSNNETIVLRAAELAETHDQLLQLGRRCTVALPAKPVYFNSLLSNLTVVAVDEPFDGHSTVYGSDGSVAVCAITGDNSKDFLHFKSDLIRECRFKSLAIGYLENGRVVTTAPGSSVSIEPPNELLQAQFLKCQQLVAWMITSAPQLFLSDRLPTGAIVTIDKNKRLLVFLPPTAVPPRETEVYFQPLKSEESTRHQNRIGICSKEPLTLYSLNALFDWKRNRIVTNEELLVTMLDTLWDGTAKHFKQILEPLGCTTNVEPEHNLTILSCEKNGHSVSFHDGVLRHRWYANKERMRETRLDWALECSQKLGIRIEQLIEALCTYKDEQDSA